MSSNFSRIHRPGVVRRRTTGFSLIELIIAVAIVALLAAMAYPSFSDAIRKSRRSDAVTALNALMSAQERWRSNNQSYANDDQRALGVTADPPGLGLSSITPNGHYSVTISTPSATGYTATATPTTGSSQLNDGNCSQLRVRVAGGNIFYGSLSATGTNLDEGSSNRCWAR